MMHSTEMRSSTRQEGIGRSRVAMNQINATNFGKRWPFLALAFRENTLCALALVGAMMLFRGRMTG
jgi:hypothetical protein